MKRFLILVPIILVVMCLTGCVIKRDDMENVNIYTTVYPIEYVANSLYGYNAKVSSIYPAEANILEYKLTEKQIKDYASGAVFIYNGLTNEKSIARDFLNENPQIKIIDVSQGLEFTYNVEELWLNPRDYLMLAHNVKNGLEEYINNKYIIEEIDKNYENLKVLISSFDADLELIPENASDTNLIIASNSLNFLEKYGFTITNIDNSTTDVPVAITSKAEKLVQNKDVKYIFKLDSEEENDLVKNLVEKGAKIVNVRSMTVKKESDIEGGITYKNMMTDFIDAIKDEVYE